MDRYKRLEQIMETNFRLNALETRELGAEIRRRMIRQSEEFRRRLDQLASYVETSFTDLGSFLENGINEQADRMDQVVEVIRHIGDSSVDVNKEIEDLKRRLKEAEDRAS